MMSDHGANPTSINKRNKDWTSKTLANPPPPSPTSDNFPYALPPPSLKIILNGCLKS